MSKPSTFPRRVACLLSLFAFWASAALAGPYQPRIINGSQAGTGELPWQVALLHDPADAYDSQFCGGTLIDPNWVVTAAHCVEDYTSSLTVRDVSNPADLYVTAGIIDLTDIEVGVTRAVDRIVVHTAYDPNTMDSDIALLHVATPLTCTYCGTIDLVTSANEASVAGEDTMAIISGWGETSPVGAGDYPTQLNKADVPIWRNSDCQSAGYGSDITSRMLCAGYDTGYANGATDSCQGDSGGPLVVDDGSGTGTFVLAGVVSFGNGCALLGYPGVYTRVSSFATWVDSTMSAGSSGGGGALNLWTLLGMGLLLGRRARGMGRAVLAAVPLFALGCAHGGGVPAGLSGEWRLAEVRTGDTVWQLPADGEQFTLHLLGDGKAAGRSACNNWRGDARIDDGRLHLSTLSSTRMRCNIDDPQRAALAGAYLAALQKAPLEYRAEDGRLQLRLPDATWVFDRLP